MYIYIIYPSPPSKSSAGTLPKGRRRWLLATLGEDRLAGHP